MSNDLLKLISKEYNDLLETGEFSDVEILVREESNPKMLNLHSCILKLHSKYFHTLLTGNRIKTKNNIIKLQCPSIFVKIYEILINLIDLAFKDTRTNITILISAYELGLTELCDYVKDHLLQDKISLIQNFDKLIEWSVAQSNGLLPSDATTWSADNISTFGDLIQPFISHINFKAINPSDFHQKIKPFKKIFDKDHYIEILKYYSFKSFKTYSHSQQSKRGFVLTELIKLSQLYKKIKSTDFSMYNYDLLVLELEIDR
ncbi:9407_t:CDS:2 [Funneliformis caledonium]|uniref:9407_t:CDS:1 n=1 Tax=Funneliformis caledonium TaxID=1117310 RepID=A0A9N9EDT2_9GLOM|nr:9407_t:CDS:2 [Funneliformis caledonium]